MAVKFVIGRAGSGKTTRCLRQTVDAVRADPLGPAILWIVPKQMTFMVERELTAALGAFCRVRVMSFDLLAAEALAACGGGAVPQVTPLGRQMILGHLLRRLQPRLAYFKSAARQPGLAAELDATFGEMERSGKSTADLDTLVAELEVSDPADVDGGSLVAKLRDLRLVYDAYGAFLGQDRLDPHRRLKHVIDLFGEWPLLRGATAYVDGFLDFSDEERKVLAALANACRDVDVTLPIDPDSPVVRDPHKLPDEHGLFRKPEQAYRRLWFAFNEAGTLPLDPVVLRETPRFCTPALRDLERATFAPTAPRVEGGGSGLQFFTAPDRAAEVDAAARKIRALLAGGLRLRDIAVLVRNLDDYHARIDATFREHGIPYFVDVRRTAAHHPLLQFVRAVIQISRFDWPHEAVMTLLKCGLACMGPDEADAVEEYVLEHRIRGGIWESDKPWTFRRRLTRSSGDEDDAANSVRIDPDRIDAARRGLAERLSPLLSLARSTEPQPLRTFITTILQLLECCGARQTLAGWMQAAADAGDFEQHDEHAQVWAELVALLEQMTELLGDQPVSVSDFSEILESGLERFDLAITPPTLDQVLVGQADRTRTPPNLRAAFVLGLNTGEFPRAARDHTVLSDAERRELRRRKVDLEGDSRQSLLDERLLGYLAFTRASDHLFLSRPAAGDGKRSSEPSAFWIRLRELFPDAEPENTPPAKEGDLAHAWTPRQVITSLMHWVRNPGPGAPEGTASVYQWLATRTVTGDGLDRTLRLAWPALGYANHAELSPDVSSRLFSPPLDTTASQLETFASCAFRHFLRYGLALTERESAGVTGLDLSRLYHHVLHALVSTAMRDGIDLADHAAPVTDATIRSLAHDIGKSLRGELMLSSARNEYLLARVEKTLREVFAAHREMLRRGSFRPKQVAVSFGAGAGAALPPLRLRTPGGADVAVSGAVDRVDAAPGGEVAAFDYRLGTRSLSLQEVYYGLSLQLLTGLLALSDGGASRPAAAFFLQTTRALGQVKHPSEALDPADPRYLLRVKPRGIVDGNFVNAFDASLAAGMSEVLNVSVNKDGRFGNRRSSDVAERAEFEALLGHVRKRIGELADGILSGEIGVRPYRVNTDTPCPRCNYRAVCRFDPAVDQYNHLVPMGKEQVLQQVASGGGNEDQR